MTDKTQPEAGSTHLIRYALELGLLWIDGSGREKVREALDALDALEAKLASIGAGGVQALNAAPAEYVGNGMFKGETIQKAAEHWANWCDVRCMTGLSEFLRFVAASPTPPAEQPIGELVVTKTRDGQIVAVTRQDDEGRILSVIATSSPEEQSQPRYSHLHDADALHGKQLSVYGTGATTGAPLGGVYAELPAPNLPRGGFPDLFTEGQMRDFADRTHALRMEQAAPKAAPGEPDPADIIAGALQISRGHAIEMMREALEAAPQQEAQEPCGWDGAEEWEKLAWHLCADENGEDACSELIWEGGPIPEPWGDRWLKYEGEARRMIALVRTHVPAPQPAPAELEQLRERISRMGLDVDRAMRGHVNEQSPLGTQRLAAIAALAKPAPAPLSGETDRLREALQRIEGASMSMYATRSDMLEHCQDIARAAIAAQGGK